MSLTAIRAGRLALACVAGALALGTTPTWAEDCLAPGQWLQPGGERLSPPALFRELAEQEVVLLGEQHDCMDHHRWQLSTLAGLHARRPDMVIGLEMLPRDAQPALDAWVAGELDEQAFLDDSRWRTAWGFDPELYFPSCTSPGCTGCRCRPSTSPRSCAVDWSTRAGRRCPRRSASPSARPPSPGGLPRAPRRGL